MAIKTIILLRHGQYSKEPSEKLTKIGKFQAKLTGKRLKDFRFDRVYHSTMPRAVETAYIITNEIKYTKKVFASNLLRECVPGFPLNLRAKHGHTDLKKLKKHRQQADKAFKKIFKFSKADSIELIVCHGNIMRYFICKSLKIQTDQWVNLDIKQCGISIIELNSKSKSVKIISHNDVGHLPLKFQTFI